MQVKEYVRHCEDIGMFSTDRPINDVGDTEGSCLHRTPYCDEKCYNVKLYKMYPNMAVKDVRSEEIWQKIKPLQVKEVLARKRKQTKRVRHCTRGEPIKEVSDIWKIKAEAKATPETTWWIPTRAWRDPTLNFLIRTELFSIKNLAINASVDPSNSVEEWDMLESQGWNIMFFGDDSLDKSPASGKRMFDCPKTKWGLKGHCGICKAGCFSQTTIGRQQIVKLYEH